MLEHLLLSNTIWQHFKIIIIWSSLFREAHTRKGGAGLTWNLSIYLLILTQKNLTSARKNEIFRWTSFTMATFCHMKISRNTYTCHTHYSWDFKVSLYKQKVMCILILLVLGLWNHKCGMHEKSTILLHSLYNMFWIGCLFLHYRVINLCIKL